MDTQNQRKIFHMMSPQSNMLAKKAKAEILQNGKTTIICPTCQTIPKMTTTSKGERTVVSCECGYTYDAEINL